MTNMLSIPIPSNKNGITECTGPKNKPKAEPRPKHTIIPIMTALNRVRSGFKFQVGLVKKTIRKIVYCLWSRQKLGTIIDNNALTKVLEATAQQA